MDVVGNVFSVAEVGEQLAWVGAALRSSPYDKEAAYSTAFVSRTSIDYDSPASVSGVCEIRFNLERLQDEDLATNGNCWRGMFRNPVIVRGYPIPRRPDAGVDTGLEIPLEIVVALTGCEKLTKFGDMAFLKGFAAMLAAVRIVGDIVFWHLCYNAKGEYISYEDGRIPRLSGSQSCSAARLTIGAMKQSRHIVGWSDNIRNFAGSYPHSHL